MNKPIRIAGFLFAIAIAVFGVQHLIYGHFGLEPLPAWIGPESQRIVAYSIGILFMAIAISLVTHFKARMAATILGVLYLLNALLMHLPRVIADLHNGNEWTLCFETLAISSGALILAGILRGRLLPGSHAGGNAQPYEGLIRSAPYFFAISLVVFAGLHFVYAVYIATLIPSWIPLPLFWSYFIGFAFAATAISIVIQKKDRLASRLLALMFFLWVAVIHIPRVVASPHTESEWTSCFIALALGAGAWMLSLRPK